MKNIFSIFCLSLLCIVCSSCITTTMNSIERGKSGDTKIVYDNLGMNAATLHSRLLNAFNVRKWTITDSGNPVKANIQTKGQNAKAVVTVSDNKLEFETAGSTAFDKPYVPIRYVDFIMKSVRNP